MDWSGLRGWSRNRSGHRGWNHLFTNTPRGTCVAAMSGMRLRNGGHLGLRLEHDGLLGTRAPVWGEMARPRMFQRRSR